MKRTKREKKIEELKQEYHTLATAANRRMTLLEKLSQKPGYETVLGYAYKNVAHDLDALEGKRRFSHDIERFDSNKTDIRHLQALIGTAREFLESPSSLKSGIDKTYGKRAKTINKKYGTQMTAEDIRTFFESSVWEKLKDRLGSHMAMKTIGRIQKNSDDIVEGVEKSRRQHKRISINALEDVDGLNVDKMLTSHDRQVIGNLAKMYGK